MSKRRRPPALRAARTGVASAVAPEARGDGPANKLAATPPRGPRRAVLFALFAASGFAGLIYESVWTHYLKLFLGHAAYAQALVLAIFMGGMAAGAAWCGRRSARIAHPLATYALVEAAIGIAALVFHAVFVALPDR